MNVSRLVSMNVTRRRVSLNIPRPISLDIYWNSGGSIYRVINGIAYLIDCLGKSDFPYYTCSGFGSDSAEEF